MRLPTVTWFVMANSHLQIALATVLLVSISEDLELQ